MKIRYLVMFLIILAALLSFTSYSYKVPKTAYIEIKDFKFMPNKLNISLGTTVIWINKDWTGYYGRPHMIVAHYNKFRSPKLKYKETFNFTFTEPGIYTYIDPVYKSSGVGLSVGKAAINVK